MTERSSWDADPPPWDNFDHAHRRRDWLKHVDACLYHLFQEEQAVAASRADIFEAVATEHLSATADARDRLSDRERSALLAGMSGLSEAEERWKLVAEIVRGGETSTEFREILSDLIKSNGFHPRVNFDKIDAWTGSDLQLYSQFIWVCDVLRRLYPVGVQNEKAILARAKDTVAHLMADDGPRVSVADAKKKVRRLTNGLESRPERARHRLLRARVEHRDRFMLNPYRIYTRK